jgi:FdhD protein
MEIVPLGKTLEIAKEKLVTLIVGDIRFNIACTPENLRELAIGFVVSEGLVNKDRTISVKVKGDVVIVESANLQHKPSPIVVKVRSSGSPGLLVSADKLPKVSVEHNFTLEECRNALKYLETDWYKRTRGYHIAALVAKSGMISRAHDVGRHNAVDKAIGMGIERNVNFARVFLVVSGRISEGMVTKCARCGIPLLVSKAAILDSAIEKCREIGLSAVSFATGIAVKGEALII